MPKEHRKIWFYYKYFLTFVDVKLYNDLIDEKGKGENFDFFLPSYLIFLFLMCIRIQQNFPFRIFFSAF